MPASFVYHNPDVVHRYYLMIPSAKPSEFKVLLQKQADDSWALPVFEPHEHHFAVVQHINDHVKEKLALNVATMRCFATHSDPNEGEIRFYALDNLSPDWEVPDTMQWASETELFDITPGTALQHNILQQWFHWRHSNDSLRAEWVRTGWYPKISNWMVDLADRMSMTGIKTPTQVQTWARSSTMRLETDDGNLFFKAVPQFFSYEPVITRVLSIRYPDRAPDVRAVHVENGWMLMREFQGETLTHIENIENWERAIKEFARMQIDMVSNTQSLVALGVPDRNIDYLASQVERLMNDLPASLTEDEKYKLRMMSSTLRSMCFELAEFNIPLTLTHGDFWSGQVIFKDDGKCLFFDWSDASISHPFFDMCTFLAEVDSELPHVENARNHLLITYLNEWTRYEPIPNLKQVYALTMVLGYLHQALFYYIHILPRVESAARWELSGMLAYLLRHILHEMKDFED